MLFAVVTFCESIANSKTANSKKSMLKMGVCVASTNIYNKFWSKKATNVLNLYMEDYFCFKLHSIDVFTLIDAMCKQIILFDFVFG